MPTNDFLPFAVDVNAGVMSQADYAERAGLGVVPGIADPDFANKAWRQGANMAAALGEMIKAQGIDALDNGEIASLSSNIIFALKSFLLPLSGGAMTGNIEMGGSYPAIMVNASNSYLRLGNVDYNGGASLYLNGKDRTLDPGDFALSAYDGANRQILNGRPDGTLTWGGKDVVLATLEDATGVNFNSVNIANNSLVNCTSNVFSPGVYLLLGTCAFGTNSTGYRQLGFSLSSTSAYIDRYSYSRCAACSDSDTTLQVLLIRKFTTSTTLYLNARQTSGSSLECSGGILYRKIV